MLNPIFAHPGQPLGPHDLWNSWNWDPVLLAALAGAVAVYQRGWLVRQRHQQTGARRRAYFVAGLAVVAVALVSPLDAMAGVLASAHMAQHLLLMVVAPVLFAASFPVVTMLRGVPLNLRRTLNHWHRRTRGAASVLLNPVLAGVAYAGALWIWHARALYEAALASLPIHLVEHTTFFITGLAFWSVVIRSSRQGPGGSGVGILLLFTVGLQGVLLSALFTFSNRPWYPSYALTAPGWGLTALADQQLAGLIMWVPTNLFYAGAIIVLVAKWLRAVEDSQPAVYRAGKRAFLSKEGPAGGLVEHPDAHRSVKAPPGG